MIRLQRQINSEKSQNSGKESIFMKNLKQESQKWLAMLLVFACFTLSLPIGCGGGGGGGGSVGGPSSSSSSSSSSGGNNSITTQVIKAKFIIQDMQIGSQEMEIASRIL